MGRQSANSRLWETTKEATLFLQLKNCKEKKKYGKDGAGTYELRNLKDV